MVLTPLFLLVGCAGPQSTSDVFSQAVEPVIDEAREKGASDQQLAFLDEARGHGSLDFELAKQAVLNAVACMKEGGIDAQLSEYQTSAGLEVPGYSAAVASPTLDMSEEAAQEIVDNCDNRESWWVLSFYQTQPSSVQLVDVELASKARALWDCLERAGRLDSLTNDATPREIANHASDVAFETNFRIDCVSEAGIDGF